MDNLSKLKTTLRQVTDNRIPVTLVWAVAQEIDWETKTMVAVGVMDGLAYYDVLLGVGHRMTKPKPRSKCLLGLIENNDAAAFMIDCEEVEAVEWSVDIQKYEMDGSKFLIGNATEDLLTLMTDTIDAILAERHLTNTGPTINLTPDSQLRFNNLKTRFNNLLKSS